MGLGVCAVFMLCQWQHLRGTPGFGATISPMLLFQATFTHAPWWGQVDLVDVDTTCNERAFWKWVGPFKHVTPICFCRTFHLVVGWPQRADKPQPSRSHCSWPSAALQAILFTLAKPLFLFCSTWLSFGLCQGLHWKSLHGSTLPVALWSFSFVVLECRHPPYIAVHSLTWPLSK